MITMMLTFWGISIIVKSEDNMISKKEKFKATGARGIIWLII